MEKNFKFYFKLFYSLFTLSAFTFGGGFVIASLMKKRYVDEYKWLTENDMLDLTAIAQSAPGSIAVNASVLLGYRVAGFPGALIAVFAAVLPPFIIITVISFIYMQFKNSAVVAWILKGMQAGVAAIICDVVIGMAVTVFKNKKVIPIALMFVSLILVAFFNVNVIVVIVICGAVGALTALKPNGGRLW